jgi:hypothetical protein
VIRRTEHSYEAFCFLGYDSVGKRHVLHLMDVFETRYSETLGYRTRDGNEIQFALEHPDGPFHTTCRRTPEKDTWRWVIEQKDKRGIWLRSRT